ncbi:hypothetical protein [Inhella sp.]|uniref:hypothetical protein n=1 Tax=Inhella sp. TaxID=1921806 RepID=UPI0035B13C27
MQSSSPASAGKSKRLKFGSIVLMAICLAGVIAWHQLASKRTEHSTPAVQVVERSRESLERATTVNASANTFDAASVPLSAPAATVGASSAPRALEQTQEMRKTVMIALQGQALSAYQAQIEDWRCDAGAACTAMVRIPPYVTASRNGDMSAAANVMDTLRENLKGSGAQVALAKAELQPQGMAIVLDVSRPAQPQGRFMTDEDIAKLRYETIRDYLKSQQASGTGNSTKQ